MTTYTIFIQSIKSMEHPISALEIMQMCDGGGVTVYDNGIIVEFFSNDEAIRAREKLEANGIKLLSGIIEAENPNYYGG